MKWVGPTVLLASLGMLGLVFFLLVVAMGRVVSSGIA